MRRVAVWRTEADRRNHVFTQFRKPLAVWTAAAALLAPTITVTPASAAPAQLPTAKTGLRKTVRADIDGDGRLDTIRFYALEKSGELRRWRISVTTASGRSGSMMVRIISYIDKPWAGTAAIDGQPGREILLMNTVDDFESRIVLTWRSGALHREHSPRGPQSSYRGDTWSTPTESDIGGYLLFSVDGKRYVKHWQSKCPSSYTPDGICTVRVARSVWRGGDWHFQAKLPAQKMTYKKVAARHLFGTLVIHT